MRSVTTRGSAGLNRMTSIAAAMVLLMVAAVGCSGGDRDVIGTTVSAVSDPSVAGFEEFSGMTVPDTAEDVTIAVSVDSLSEPVYLAGFDLPSDQIDQFCREGQMQRPLHVVTIPDSVRTDFGYQGDSSTGVSIGGSLLLGPQHQRDILAVGTNFTVAHVQVRAYDIGR